VSVKGVTTKGTKGIADAGGRDLEAMSEWGERGYQKGHKRSLLTRNGGDLGAVPGDITQSGVRCYHLTVEYDEIGNI